MVKRIQLLGLAIVFLLLGRSVFWQTIFAAGTIVTVNTTGDDGDASPGDGLCATANGQCSLRAAIEELNGLGPDANPHQIHFDISGSGPHLIVPASELPPVEVPVVIDGETQPEATCPTSASPANLQIVLDGSDASFVTGLRFYAGSDGSTVRGLVIGNFSVSGIVVKSDNNRIECNHIGLGVDGVSNMGNASAGIAFDLFSDNNTVGGEASHSQRNVISGNREGIYISKTENNVVANNYIGTTADGLSPLGNEQGVFISSSVTPATVSHTIGGTSPLAGNVISGNTRTGVRILDGKGNKVWGNYIGVGSDGITAVANGRYGFDIGGTSTGNIIGGPTASEQNVVAYNGLRGVLVAYRGAGELIQNQIRGNSMFENGTGVPSQIGIDLGDDSVDVNDPGDTDVGPNLHQNYPVLSQATDTILSGVLDSVADQTYTLDFYSSQSCHASGYGEGEHYLGSTMVTTDGSGHADFTFGLTGSVSPEDSLTATATDSQGNTSEFSACITAPGTPPTETPTPSPTPAPEPASVVHLPVVMKAISVPLFTGTLTNTGIVEGPDGVGIGAYGTTLNHPLEVTISATSPPTTTLPDGVQALSSYFRFSAEVDTFVSTSAPFVLAFPVPAGSSTSGLTVGVLVPAESYLGDFGTEPEWEFLEGQYDRTQNLFLATLPYLDQDGRVFVLVDHPDFQASANQHTAENRPAGFLDTFNVQCRGFHNGPECPLSTVEQAEDLLDDMHTFFRDIGYPDPRLKNLVGKGEYPPNSNSLASLGYSAYLEPQSRGRCSRSNGQGYYLPETGHLALCADDWAGGIAEQSVPHQLLIHEYFHSLEHAYDNVMADVSAGTAEKWITEGMAAAAQDSFLAGEMKRSQLWAVHKVDVSLEFAGGKADLDEYAAQDFWVYYGQKNGLRLSYFKDVLVRGATTEDVADALDDNVFITRLLAYWEWAKNQAMVEDDINFDGALGARCTFQTDVVATSRTFLIGEEPWTYSSALPPLTSHVVELEFVPVLEGTDRIIFAASSPDLQSENLRSKIYVDGEPSCRNVAPGDRLLEDVTSEKKYYVVISNIDPQATKNYVISWD